MAAFQGAMQLNQMLFGGMNPKGSAARVGGSVVHMAGKVTEGTTSTLGMSAMDMNLRLTDNAITSSSRSTKSSLACSTMSSFLFRIVKSILAGTLLKLLNNHGKCIIKKKKWGLK